MDQIAADAKGSRMNRMMQTTGHPNNAT